MSAYQFNISHSEHLICRPLVPADKVYLEAGLPLLSPESRYNRFFRPVQALSASELRFFTEVDQQSHVAWGMHTAEERPLGIGVGRYVHLPEQPGTAEFAITVIDPYQRRGIGSHLLDLLLALARQQGLHTLRGYFLPERTFYFEWLGRWQAAFGLDGPLRVADISTQAV